MGISKRTIQPWNKDGIEDKRKYSDRKIVRKLNNEERDEVYSVSCSQENKDMNPHEIYISLFDKEVYLASESSFYRILLEHNTATHHRKTKKGTSCKKPAELRVTAKNQVWMWDIVWLKSQVQGQYYYAYVVEDLFDRSIVGWAIHDNESDKHVKELFELVTRTEKAILNLCVPITGTL